MGGRTAFPNIGLSATAEKGAAVFWYNLNRDGTEDDNSMHGGCPVLYGVKWGESNYFGTRLLAVVGTSRSVFSILEN